VNVLTPENHFEEQPVPEITEVRHLRYEADGTRYEMMAFRVRPGDFSFGSMGTVTDGWLVVSHLYRKAYLFQPTGHLDEDYVAEKLLPKAHRSRADARNMTILLRKLIDRP